MSQKSQTGGAVLAGLSSFMGGTGGAGGAGAPAMPGLGVSSNTSFTGGNSKTGVDSFSAGSFSVGSGSFIGFDIDLNDPMILIVLGVLAALLVALLWWWLK